MKGSVTPYLTLYGKGKEAADFYQKVFGLELVAKQTYGEADFPSPEEAENFILHCLLQKGDFRLMLADTVDEKPLQQRSGLALVVECETDEEAVRIYDALAQDGKILMELQDTFWGAKYGKVKDQYGFVWDLNVEK